MNRLLICAAAAIIFGSCAGSTPEGMLLVKGGKFRNANSNYYDTGIEIPDFYIGIYEVTQDEWTKVMGSDPSVFKGDGLPVDSVNWYEAVEYCNKRSENEGLEPYYGIDKDAEDPANTNERDDMKWTVTIHKGANGYRLPSETEWEYAAGGGRKSRSYIYSGGNEIDRTSWYWKNSGDTEPPGAWNWKKIENNNNRTHPVGSKKPNELGLYDMSGNVREWCWEWYTDPGNANTPTEFRVWKGGGWLGGAQSCETSHRSSFDPNAKSGDQGFRICRNK